MKEEKVEKRAKKAFVILLLITVVGGVCVTATEGAQEPIVLLELGIPDTARVVDYDKGIYVVGTSGGNLYIINEAGEYTVTALGAGSIRDVRIENPFIVVAAGNNTVLKLSINVL